jgi:hypothetical protein
MKIFEVEIGSHAVGQLTKIHITHYLLNEVIKDTNPRYRFW